MVKMKRLFLLCAFVSMFATCNFISAQKELGIFNSVSAGVGVGLTGVDVEVATPITPYLALRGGLTFMPGFSINTDMLTIRERVCIMIHTPWMSKVA